MYSLSRTITITNLKITYKPFQKILDFKNFSLVLKNCRRRYIGNYKTFKIILK